MTQDNGRAIESDWEGLIQKACLIYITILRSGFLLGILILAASRVLPWPISLDNGEKISKIAESFFKIIAIIVAGTWTYFIFIKERVLLPRLEPTPAGKICVIDAVPYLVATLELKNVGSSRIDIQQTGSGLDVFFYTFPTDAVSLSPYQPYSIPWGEPWSFKAFEDHNWIEPGETIREEQLIALPPHLQFAIKLQLIVNVNEKTITGIAVLEHQHKERQKRTEPIPE